MRRANWRTSCSLPLPDPLDRMHLSCHGRQSLDQTQKERYVSDYYSILPFAPVSNRHKKGLAGPQQQTTYLSIWFPRAVNQIIPRKLASRGGRQWPFHIAGIAATGIFKHGDRWVCGCLHSQEKVLAQSIAKLYFSIFLWLIKLCNQLGFLTFSLPSSSLPSGRRTCILCFLLKQCSLITMQAVCPLSCC